MGLQSIQEFRDKKTLIVGEANTGKTVLTAGILKRFIDAGEKDLDSMTIGRRQVWLVLNNPHESNHIVTKSGPFDVYTETDSATASWLAAHRSDILDEQHFAGLTVLLVRLVP